MTVWIAHEEGRALMGPLPPGTELAVFDGTDFPADPAAVRFWVPPFLSSGSAVAKLPSLTGLEVVQLLSAGADAWVNEVPRGVTLCDAAGVHDSATAEWAAAVILAATRELPRFVLAQAEGRWDHGPTPELAGRRVLIVGAGSIGSALADRLDPFGVDIVRVARTARAGVHGVGELPELLPGADVVVILVPLTPETRGLVDAAFLARMRDGALLVNAARGPVVRTEDLYAELASGRLRAAADVTDPEPLPPGHPLWTAPGLLLTPHVAGSVPGLLPRAYRLVGAQLRRYAAGDPLVNVVIDGY
jgi:phosphoglycerate dehydrogenase-like enzyme